MMDSGIYKIREEEEELRTMSEQSVPYTISDGGGGGLPPHYATPIPPAGLKLVSR